MQFSDPRLAAEARAGLDGTRVPAYMAPSHPNSITMRVGHSMLPEVTIARESEWARWAGSRLFHAGHATRPAGTPWRAQDQSQPTAGLTPAPPPHQIPHPHARDYTEINALRAAEAAAVAEEAAAAAHVQAAALPSDGEGCCVLLAMVRLGAATSQTAHLLPALAWCSMTLCEGPPAFVTGLRLRPVAVSVYIALKPSLP